MLEIGSENDVTHAIVHLAQFSSIRTEGVGFFHPLHSQLPSTCGYFGDENAPKMCTREYTQDTQEEKN